MNDNENDDIKTMDEPVLEEEEKKEETKTTTNDENSPTNQIQTPAVLPQKIAEQPSKQILAYAKVSKILQDICETRGFDFHSSSKCTNYLDMQVLNVVGKCNEENKPFTENETDNLLNAASQFLDELTVCKYTGEYAYEIPISGTYHINKTHYFLYRCIIKWWKCRFLIMLIKICLFYSFIMFLFYLFAKYIYWSVSQFSSIGRAYDCKS